MKSWVLVGSVLVGVALVSCAALYVLFPQRPAARQEIISLSNRISLGVSAKKVRSLFQQGRYPHLKLQAETDQWQVTTPFEFGAGNWYLYVEISADKVTSVKVRTADSYDEKPVGAPEDKVVASVKPGSEN